MPLMKKLATAVFLLALVLSQVSAFAQQSGPKVRRIKTIPVKAEVVGVLEDNKVLAVIRVLQVDSTNNIGLKVGEEVLTEFIFSTKPVKGEEGMTGVIGGEVISAQMAGAYNPNTRQYDYRIIRYSVRSKMIKLNSEKQKN